FLFPPSAILSFGHLLHSFIFATFFLFFVLLALLYHTVRSTIHLIYSQFRFSLRPKVHRFLVSSATSVILFLCLYLETLINGYYSLTQRVRLPAVLTAHQVPFRMCPEFIVHIRNSASGATAQVGVLLDTGSWVSYIDAE